MTTQSPDQSVSQSPKLKVTTSDNQYTIVFADGKLSILRWGEPWKDATGDNCIYLLAQDLADAKEPHYKTTSEEVERIVQKWFARWEDDKCMCEAAIRGAANEAASLTQSPAASKDVEERIRSMVARVFSGSFGYKPLLRQDMVQVLSEFAAELGKEREAERKENPPNYACKQRRGGSDEKTNTMTKTTIQLLADLINEGGAIVSSDKCSELEIKSAQHFCRFASDEEGFGFVRHTKEWVRLNQICNGEEPDATYVETLKEMVYLRSQEIETLKRELAETVEVARKYQHEVLALSASYQRQKVAIAWCLGMEPSPCRCMDFATPPHVCVAHKALAETPDVSMLEKVVAALKLAYARGHYCDNVPCPGCECGHVLDSILGRTVSQDECEQFVTSHFIKVSTLQPDHQK